VDNSSNAPSGRKSGAGANARGSGGKPPGPRLGPADDADDTPTVEQIARTLELLSSPEVAIELRAPQFIPEPGKPPTNVVHRFAPGAYVAAASKGLEWSGRAPAVYLVMNGVDPTLPNGRIGAGAAAKAGQIPRRRWLLIDVDPVRKAGSSTDDEKAAALAMVETIRKALRARGWPAPIVADSGNGYHLLYLIDLPNDAASTALVKGTLEALARQYDTPGASVDTKVYDAPRLVKLYGTLAMKGEVAPDRPHRFARVLSRPERLNPIPPAKLAELADEGKPIPVAVPAGQPRQGGRNDRDEGRWTPEMRAVAYLATCEPSISGQRGHDKAFKAACKVGPGFDLDPSTVLRLLAEHYNPRCQPPWSEKELDHKVGDAYAKETRRGWLLHAPRNGKTDDRPPLRKFPRDDEAGRELPRIICGDETPEEGLKTWTPAAMEALASHNAPPRVFQSGNSIVRIRPADVDAPPTIGPLSGDALRGELDRSASWGTEYRDKKGQMKVRFGPPRMDIVRDIMALNRWEEEIIPRLDAVAEVPRFLPDGRLLGQPGYYREARLFYTPAPGMLGLDIPDRPAGHEVDAARSLLEDDLLHDFTLANQASRANAIAFILLPFVRAMIAGPTPLHHFGATTEGTGKTLLAACCAYPSLGREVTTSPQKESEAEYRKAVMAVLRSGVSHYLLDNLNNPTGWDGVSLPVDSGVLANVLTSHPFYSDRILGLSEDARVMVNICFASTGNNVWFSRELNRRIVLIELVTPIENPSLRTGFKYDPIIKEFVEPRRIDLLRACLTLCRHWIAEGMPKGEQTMGRFESYAQTMGGILGCMGVEGFLGNRTMMIDRNTESRRWGDLIEQWAKVHGTSPVTAGLLWDTIGADPDLHIAFADLLGEGSTLSQKQRLGRALEKQSGQVWGDWRIVPAAGSNRNKVAMHKLKPATDRYVVVDDEEETPNNRGTYGSF